jgi:hypothetical protein
MPPRYSTPSSSTSRNYYTSSSRASSQPSFQQAYPPRRSTTPAHSYDVFVSSSSDGLVHKRSSNRDDFHHVPKEDAIAGSTGRHVCPECGRRFEKLSTLKVRCIHADPIRSYIRLILVQLNRIILPRIVGKNVRYK